MKPLSSSGIFATRGPVKFYVIDNFGNAIEIDDDQLDNALDFVFSATRSTIPH